MYWIQFSWIKKAQRSLDRFVISFFSAFMLFLSKYMFFTKKILDNSLNMAKLHRFYRWWVILLTKILLIAYIFPFQIHIQYKPSRVVQRNLKSRKNTRSSYYRYWLPTNWSSSRWYQSSSVVWFCWSVQREWLDSSLPSSQRSLV